MATAIGVWISVDEATIIERRGDERARVSRLVRGGRGADDDECPDAFCFRVLDAIRHADRIFILGCDGACEGLREKAQMYSFLRHRIAGVFRATDGFAPSVARRLDELMREQPAVVGLASERSLNAARGDNGLSGKFSRRAALAGAAS